MVNKIFLDDYILNYEKVCKYLFCLTNKNFHSKRSFITNTLGKTNFSFPINSYQIGKGNKHIVIVGTTHGCEILTTYFVLETMIHFLMDDSLFNNYALNYTFHFIPVLNPEGFIISSSNVWPNICNLDFKKLEQISKLYLNKYNFDDKMANLGLQRKKEYKTVLKSSLKYIKNNALRFSVYQILKDCNLRQDTLPIWSSNGIGIDPNVNSIHKFYEISEIRKKQRFHKLRYNDIPVYKPSPIGFAGFDPLSHRCPETYFFNKFIKKLYTKNFKSKDEKLIAIFSYHTTGGEIYSVPDKLITSTNNINIHYKAAKKYSQYTNYELKDENIKYGFMDYYRSNLENVVSLTIELSKNNGNPIGPFSNIFEILEEIKQNKIALFETVDYINKIIQ